VRGRLVDRHDVRLGVAEPDSGPEALNGVLVGVEYRHHDDGRGALFERLAGVRDRRADDDRHRVVCRWRTTKKSVAKPAGPFHSHLIRARSPSRARRALVPCGRSLSLTRQYEVVTRKARLERIPW